MKHHISQWHYNDIIMGTMASQTTSLTIVHSSVYSGADKRKHQSSASLTFVRGIQPVTSEFPAQMASNAEMFPFDDVIMDDRHWSGPRAPRNEEAFWVRHKSCRFKTVNITISTKNQPTNQPTKQTNKHTKVKKKSWNATFIPSRNNMAAALH